MIRVSPFYPSWEPGIYLVEVQLIDDDNGTMHPPIFLGPSDARDLAVQLQTTLAQLRAVEAKA